MSGGKAVLSKRRRTSGLRKRQPSERTVEAILNAAEIVIAKDIESDFTLSQVARLLGISKSTIFHHFGSKSALIEAVRTRAAARSGT